MVSGKLPPGKFSPEKFPPIKLPLVNLPQKIPTQKISTWNIPTHIFKYSCQNFLNFCFFILSLLSLILLKRLITFVVLCFKSTEARLFAVYQKNLACRPKWLHTQKRFAGQL